MHVFVFYIILPHWNRIQGPIHRTWFENYCGWWTVHTTKQVISSNDTKIRKQFYLVVIAIMVQVHICASVHTINTFFKYIHTYMVWHTIYLKHFKISYIQNLSIISSYDKSRINSLEDHWLMLYPTETETDTVFIQHTFIKHIQQSIRQYQTSHVLWCYTRHNEWQYVRIFTGEAF